MHFAAVRSNQPLERQPLVNRKPTVGHYQRHPLERAALRAARLRQVELRGHSALPIDHGNGLLPASPIRADPTFVLVHLLLHLAVREHVVPGLCIRAARPNLRRKYDMIVHWSIIDHSTCTGQSSITVHASIPVITDRNAHWRSILVITDRNVPG